MLDFRAILASFEDFSDDVLFLNATVGLAQCLSLHAEREDDLPALREAILQYERLRQITDTLEPSKAALTKLNHAQALRRLGCQTRDEVPLTAAARLYQSALFELDRGAHAGAWSVAQDELRAVAAMLSADHGCSEWAAIVQAAPSPSDS